MPRPDVILPCKVASPRFHAGDRVTRERDVYNQRSPLMHGTVTKVYAMRGHFGYYPEMYEVEWDHDGRRPGYLPHGLDPEKE
jgi:hypothetical protein